MPKSTDTTTVCWRLPAGMIDELGPSGIREMLDRWRKSRRRVRARDDQAPLVNRCYNVPAALVAALDREADRLADETGVAWSHARVVREIWETGAGR